MNQSFDKNAALGVLNRILELELAGVVRYTHYALMVYGYNRLPIVGWLNAQADESLLHARQAGELITSLGGHPSLGIGSLLETHQHDIGDILRESLAHEKEALAAYYHLLDCARDKDVRLEEYARTLIAEEQTHQDEVDKMLRAPGQTSAYAAGGEVK
jgi:bacterioferritin